MVNAENLNSVCFGTGFSVFDGDGGFFVYDCVSSKVYENMSVWEFGRVGCCIVEPLFIG